MNKIIKYGLILIGIIVMVMSVYNFTMLAGYFKTCTHVECKHWAEGNEWVALHCVANETINDFVCNFDWNKQTFINIPLKVVQDKIPEVRTCTYAICASEFLGKGVNVKYLKNQTDNALEQVNSQRYGGTKK